MLAKLKCTGTEFTKWTSSARLQPGGDARAVPAFVVGQIYTVLAYYYGHQAEFEAEILRQAERAKAWAEAAKDSPIRQRLKKQGLLP